MPREIAARAREILWKNTGCPNPAKRLGEDTAAAKYTQSDTEAKVQAALDIMDLHLHAGAAQPVGDPFAGPAGVRVMARKGADARDAQKFEEILFGLLPSGSRELE